MGGKIKASLPLNILIALGAIGALGGLSGIVRETIGLRMEYVAAQAKIEALQSERARLEARLAELATPDAIEREAKEKFNLKKKGEIAVVVLPEKFGIPTKPEGGAWERIKDFFRRAASSFLFW